MLLVVALQVAARLHLLLDDGLHVGLLLLHRARVRLDCHGEARLAEAQARRPLVHLVGGVGEREQHVEHVGAAEPLLQDHRELRLAEGDVLGALGEALDDERELSERQIDLEALRSGHARLAREAFGRN